MKKIVAFLCAVCLVFALMPVCFAETPVWEALVTFPCEDHLIPSTICVPVGDGPFPAVVMLHGTYSNRDEGNGAYWMAAQTLAGKYGIASIRIDFMGCGASMADFLDYTFESAVNDASAAAELMQSLRFIDPEHIGVLGWSQGGTDALLCGSRRPDLFKSIVTWAGAPDLKECVTFTDEDYRKTKENGFFEMYLDWRDPVKFSLQLCEDVLNTDVLGEFSEKYSGPVLAIHGREDTFVDPIWCERIAAASKNPASSSLYVDGADHIFNVYSEKDFHSLYTAIDAAGEFFSKTLK